MAYTISTSKNTINAENITTNTNPYIVDVHVNGSATDNSYYVIYDEEWLTVNRNRNQLEIYIKDNLTIYDRETDITVYHQCDANVYTNITVKQERTVFEINADTTNVSSLKPVFEIPFEYEDKIINLTIKGGRKKYIIKDIRQEYNDNGMNFTVEYDGGLNLILKDDKTLIVRNYGRTFLNDDCYYKIILAHADNNDITCEIKVNYAPYNRERTEIVSTFRMRNNIYNLQKIREDISYTPPITEEIEVPMCIEEEIIKEVSLEKNKLIISTCPDDVMLSCKLTGRWCVMENVFDKEKRQHIITVNCKEKEKNVWGIERKCRLIIRNAENNKYRLLYIVSNKKDTDIEIKKATD